MSKINCYVLRKKQDELMQQQEQAEEALPKVVEPQELPREDPVAIQVEHVMNSPERET
jgi:hypothetical protein